MAEVTQHVFNGFVVGAAYALIGIGLTLILGVMNVVNFAHGELYMLGGFFLYTLAILFAMNFFVAVLVATIGVMVFGWLTERAVLRPLRSKSLESRLLAMIGLSIVLQNAAVLIWGPFPQTIRHSFSPHPMVVGPVYLTQIRLFAALVAVALIIATHLLVQKTRLGKAVRATFQDQEMAALLGVRVDSIHAFTFALGSGLAAVAGALLGAIFVIKPTMGEFAVVKAFAVVIVGGMGSFPGAIVGGLILGVAESLGAGYVSSGYKDAIGFALIILVLVLRPAGLFSTRA